MSSVVCLLLLIVCLIIVVVDCLSVFLLFVIRFRVRGAIPLEISVVMVSGPEADQVRTVLFVLSIAL